MDLFHSVEAREYFEVFYQKMKAEVNQITDQQIVSCDLQEWREYLVGKYYIVPISLFESNIERALSEATVKKANSFSSYPGERSYFEEDGVQVTFKIPFDGNPELFRIRPSTYVMSSFFTRSFIPPRGESCGSFTIDLEYTKKELQDQGDAMLQYVQKEFENKFGSYKEMIGYVNDDVKSYNDKLADSAMRLLEERKNKAEAFSAISATLEIPLIRSKNAPNIKPIPLKRVNRKPAVRPTSTPIIPEACISDDDYENINSIIAMCGTTMEKSARTYFSSLEEELRDILLATLNTHYKEATGETFRKIGKTDILIEFENKAAFIGECKIWHGDHVFQGAIQQVLNYSTWRDLKVSVIIFNKENRSFSAILSKINTWVDTHTKKYTRPQMNIWKCIFYRQDMNIDIQLTILAFDLYVDKSQFKDRRYGN